MTRADAERLAGLPAYSPIRRPEGPIDIRKIMLLVCEALDVKLSLVMSPCRKSEAICGRRTICAVLRAKGLSYPDIGRRLGIDHTTVRHHCVQFDKACAMRPEMRIVYNAMMLARPIEEAAADLRVKAEWIANLRRIREAQRRAGIRSADIRQSLKRQVERHLAAAANAALKLEQLACH